MSVRLKPIAITDPMLVDFHNQDKDAFFKTKKYLMEAQLKLAEMDEEIETFKSWIISVVDQYQNSPESLPSFNELKVERESYLKQYQEFQEVYVKVSTVAYRTIRVINSLQTAFRSPSEGKYFEKNAHPFYVQMLELEKVCLGYADELQAMFTKIVHQKSVTLASIEDIELTGALEKLRIIVENKNVRPSRASQFLNYFSPYAVATSNRELSPEPIKKDPPKRAALTLNISAIPPYKPAQTPSLQVRVSPSTSQHLERSPSHRFPLFSTSGSSPRSLQISELSTSSPRPEPFFPAKARGQRAADSWESISIGASSARKSVSSREESPRSYVRRGMSTRELSPREISSPRYSREREVASPRGASPHSHRVRDRETLSVRRGDPIPSSQEKTPPQIRISHRSAREPTYRSASDRRPEPISALEEKRKRHSMKPSIQYKEEKPYRR